MPRRSREESEATAARVLEAATELFARDGYARVALEAVAAAAGVTRGAVYHHYAGKAELFRAVVSGVQLRVADAVAAAAEAETDPWRGLEAGCRAFLAASSAPGMRRIVLVDAPAVLGWQEWRTADAAGSGRLLAEALTQLHDAGRLGDRPVGATAALLSGAMNEAALWIAAEPDTAAAIEEAWAPLCDMLRALRRD
ncbi:MULTISPECIES: TetR family transcriptional regulator [unclassified Blastococcus]